ncbi:hypothetical protein MP228_006781 [Amoeboaphelidium protococcarum]|nr:hypothetical protein MP228_006781 [Amoeboaphelidium protococcarum]
MNQNCAKCNKIVYPTDKIQAINQTFHKLCFKCNECGLTLNLKNFQSFNQTPYCKAHLPKHSATVVADTPENNRIRNVAQMVSNVQYRADYEKMKGDAGGFGQAALEAPEIKNSMKAAQQISQVRYTHMAHDGPTNSAQSNNSVHSANRSIASASPAVSNAMINQYSAPAPVASSGVEVQQQQQQQAVRASQQQLAPEDVRASAQNIAAILYKASFAYHPDADDELSFDVGDSIVDAQVVAEGWLYGTNQRTGKAGLVPEPYVQKV